MTADRLLWLLTFAAVAVSRICWAAIQLPYAYCGDTGV